MNSIGLFLLLGLIGLAFSLAHVADRQEDGIWRIAGSFILAAFWAAVAALGSLMLVAGQAGPAIRDAIDAGDPALKDALAGSPVASQDVGRIAEVVHDAMPTMGLWILAAAALAVLLLLPWPRRLLARLLPIDPMRLVHTMALHAALFLVLYSVMTALVINGFLGVLESGGKEELAKTLAEASTLGSLWAQQLGFVVLAFLGVGLFATRGLREAADRLGLLGGFSWRWFIGTVAVGIVMALLVQAGWGAFLPESKAGIEELSEMLFGPLVGAGLLGALTIGLSAGLGEEMLFRGAAQPRLGLLLTSLLFAVIHTHNGVTPALAQILALGLVLGLVRQRAGTVTAIAAHATYNFIFVMAAVIGNQVPLWPGGPVVPIPEEWKPTATPPALVSPALGQPPALAPLPGAERGAAARR